MMTASIVAMLGAIMAAPFATPLTVTLAPAIVREACDQLGKGVGRHHGGRRVAKRLRRGGQPAERGGNSVGQFFPRQESGR